MRQHPRRPLHLTEDLVARVERFEPDSGLEAGLTPLSDEDRESTARDLLAQSLPDDRQRGGVAAAGVPRTFHPQALAA